MSKEKATYVTYAEGQEAKHLHLGNLSHDFKNPNDYDPYIEKSYTDIAEPPPAWTSLVPLENYALTLTSEDDDDDDEDDDDGPYEKKYSVAAAEKTTKVEITNPEKFFNEVTLKSDEAKKWLSSHLSAALSVPVPKGKPRPRPQIWLLTGLILMQHATWTSLTSKEHFTPGLQAPFNPPGVSAIRKLSVSDAVKPTFGLEVTPKKKSISGATILETGKYPGTRVWAAQWNKIDFELAPLQKVTNLQNNQLKLTVNSEGAAPVASLELDEDFQTEEDEDEPSAESFGEEYWDKLLDTADQIVQA